MLKHYHLVRQAATCIAGAAELAVEAFASKRVEHEAEITDFDSNNDDGAGDA